jgi:hypothetical protein
MSLACGRAACGTSAIMRRAARREKMAAAQARAFADSGVRSAACGGGDDSGMSGPVFMSGGCGRTGRGRMKMTRLSPACERGYDA